MKDLIRLLRPKHFVKNVFVFAPVFFSLSFGNHEKLLLAAYAFIVFSLAASGVYILNDILDLEEDRQHPEKKDRPLASGRVKVRSAFLLMIVFFALTVVLCYAVSITLLLVLCAYIVNNVLYSFRLKHVSVLDVVMIAVGFLLRVIGGGVITGIEISIWLITMTFLLALFLGIAKRREDVKLLEMGLRTRKNVDGYNLEFINASMVLMAGVLIVSYLLYTVSPEIQQKFNTHNLYITSFFVVVGVLRYLQITFVEDNSGNPTTVLFTDRFLQVVIGLWILSFIYIARLL